MNDFERIYTVIKSQYSCGVPFYNYDNCTYDSLSNMYYQQGVLSLQNSTGYSNVLFNDIPVACGFPNTVYRQCVPSEPPDEEENPVLLKAGFRININGAYVYPESNNLILKNPMNFNMDIDTGEEAKTNLSNSLYLFEKKGFNTCIKHANIKKYIGLDTENNFILIDDCKDTNSFTYNEEQKKLIYKLDNNCVNPDKYYQIVPNNTNMVLSRCEQSIDVILENENTPIDYYSKLKLLAENEKILNPSITIPSTYISKINPSITVPTSMYISNVWYYQSSSENYHYKVKERYGYDNINKTNYTFNTKCKYSNVSFLVLVQTDTKSCAFLSFNNGVTWTQLTNSTTIQDIDMSRDGKYITLTDTTNYYISNNANTDNIILTKRNYLFSITKTDKTVFGNVVTQSYCNVVMSKDGKYQYIYDYKNVMYSDDFGSNFGRIYGNTNLEYIPLCLSSNGLYSLYINNNIINFLNITLVTDTELDFTLRYAKKSLMSNDGKHFYMIDDVNIYCNNNYLNKNNWRIINLNIMKNLVETVLGRRITTSEKGNSIDICISKNGKFVYVLYTQVIYIDNDYKLLGFIFYSNDYGVNFKQLKTDDDYLNNNLTKLSGIDVSDDGLNIVFSYNDKIYTTKIKDIPDDTIDKQTFVSQIVSVPAKHYKFMNVVSGRSQVIKNGKNLFSIVSNSIRVFGIIPNFNSFKISDITNISNICKSFGFNSNSFVLFTVDNKLYYSSSYSLSETQIYELQDTIRYMTFEVREKSIYILLTDKINYSYDRVNWYTVNMISKKWKMAYIVPQLKNNEFTIYCVEEYGKFYFSYDSGLTWKSNDILENYNWVSIDCTDDGKIVIATIKNDFPLISYDGGLSFSYLKIDEILTDNSGNYVKQFVDCAINSNGKVMSLIIDNGRILTSYDNGKTWIYYGQYDFYQYGIKIEDINRLFTISTSFRFTRITGYSYSPSGGLNGLFSGNFSFEVNTTTNPTYRLEGNNMIYIGLDPGTYDAEQRVNIKADYIEIKYIYYLKLKFILLGGGTTSSSIFSGIKEILIMGSNDDTNFYKLRLRNPLPKTRNISKVFQMFVENENYYKTYRFLFIVEPLYIDGTLRNSRVLTYFNLEGDISYYTTQLNTISRWKNVVYNFDNFLLYHKDDQILQGYNFDPIFTEYNINRYVVDTIENTSRTLTSDLYVNNLTINSGVTLRTNGFRIFCRGKLINNGTITNDGNLSSTGSRLGKGSEGGNGGIGSSTITSSTSGVKGQDISLTITNNNNFNRLPKGGSGGNRGNNSVLGGSGGDVTNYNDLSDLSASEAIVFRTSEGLLQGGSGGGGGAGGSFTSSSYNGGKGGRGGGIIMICANEIENNGIITVRGEDGKSPSSFSSATILGGGGGGGGGGGNIVIVTKYTTNFSNTGYIVSGGKGGSGQINTSNSSLSGKNGENGIDGSLVVIFV
jgi:hypothetical protein